MGPRCRRFRADPEVQETPAAGSRTECLCQGK